MKQLQCSKLYLILAGIAFNFLLSCQPYTKKYDNVIGTIKKLDMPLGKMELYKMKDFTDISTLERLPAKYEPDRGQAVGLIWIYKTEKNLVVFIETEDDGHAGEYGVAYSETGEIPVWDGDNWAWIDEEWSIDDKINEHWWNISFRLE